MDSGEESILPDLDLDLVVLPSESDSESESADLRSPGPRPVPVQKILVKNADDANNNADDEEENCEMILSNLLDDDDDAEDELVTTTMAMSRPGGQPNATSTSPRILLVRFRYPRPIPSSSPSLSGDDRDPLGDPDPDPSKIKDAESPYVCSEPDCAQAYRRKDSLRLHVRTVHRGEEKPLNKCRQCGEAFAHRRNRLEHEKTHHSIVVTQAVITSGTGAASTKTGTETETGSGPKSKRNRLEHENENETTHRHSIQVTSGSGTSSESDPVAAAASKTGTGTGSDPQPVSRQFKCQYCQKIFLKAGALRRHELNMHLVETRHQQRQPQAPLPCATCGKIFRVASQLAYHSLIHSDPTSRPRFYCDRCPANFGRKDSLNLHLETHGEKKFKCRHGDCDKSFTRKSYRDGHELVHTKVRDFLCEICSKTCPSSSALAMHRRSHTGYKPHKCEHCGATYTQSSNLKYHVLSKHAKFEDRKYVCPVCPEVANKRFVRHFELDVHLRDIHTAKIDTGSTREERRQQLGIKCDLCHYRFRTKIQLKSHRKIKHGRFDEVPVPVQAPLPGIRNLNPEV